MSPNILCIYVMSQSGNSTCLLSYQTSTKYMNNIHGIKRSYVHNKVCYSWINQNNGCSWFIRDRDALTRWCFSMGCSILYTNAVADVYGSVSVNFSKTLLKEAQKYSFIKLNNQTSNQLSKFVKSSSKIESCTQYCTLANI